MKTLDFDSRFFPLIFEAIPHGIFTVDSSGLVTSFNRMAEKLTGYTREETIGKPCSSVFQSELCHTRCPLRISIDTGRIEEDREVTITTKSGTTLPIAISTVALRDDKDRVIGGVEMFRDLRQVMELRRRLHRSFVFEDIVSKNHHMRRIFEVLPLVANSDSSVLIEGDSGTGKELVARAIHNLGSRKDRPFVAINCGAIPENLIESELFGYKKGAFTDARHDKPGRFAMAEGGTLLLDEVGDLSRQTQVKLLRVLQEKEYEPLGATKTVNTDVRVIASTNHDLGDDVARRKFRQDLYYRLNVVQITLPPLRERREDIPLLVRHFIERFNAMQGRRIKVCSERVMSVLMRYQYPGNIRELENIIEHAFVVCTDNTIQMDDLPRHIIEYADTSIAVCSARIAPLEEAEARTIRSVLEANDYNRTLAAKELGVARNTLWRKMKKFGISEDQ